LLFVFLLIIDNLIFENVKLIIFFAKKIFSLFIMIISLLLDTLVATQSV